MEPKGLAGQGIEPVPCTSSPHNLGIELQHSLIQGIFAAPQLLLASHFLDKNGGCTSCSLDRGIKPGENALVKRELKVLADVSARAKAITKRLLNKGPSLIFSFSCSYIQIRVFRAEILVRNIYE